VTKTSTSKSKAAAPDPIPAEFTRVRRSPRLGTHRRELINEILDATPLCHIAHVVEGRPVAIPTLHWRIEDQLYWHGSTASRMIRTQETGAAVCLTVTLLDGWVLARSAFHHTMNYRSVMCFGQPQCITEDDDKLDALELFMRRWLPGRWEKLRPTKRKELAATAVMSMPIQAASAKVRSGPPDEPKADQAWPVWAGHIPLELKTLTAQPAPGLDSRLPRPRLGAALRRSKPDRL
jgi:nitroimidazol reductase NimA-like FMN-containing flavoprotein (pyridoxamine 5'-phosphate oxidase superfamily)